MGQSCVGKEQYRAKKKKVRKMPAQGRGRQVPGQTSQISAGTRWHPLSRFFEKPTSKILYKGFSYCKVYCSPCFTGTVCLWSLIGNCILPPSGGRGKLLNEEQELAIVDMVIADNEIKLKEIQSRVVEDNLVFGNISAISITSISRTLDKQSE